MIPMRLLVHLKTDAFGCLFSKDSAEARMQSDALMKAVAFTKEQVRYRVQFNS